MKIFPYRVFLKWLVRVCVYLLLFAVIASFLNPLGGHRLSESGRKVQAKTDATQLLAAVTAYHKDYGTMPSGDSLEILLSLHGNNTRKIVFIEFYGKQIYGQGSFLDPWKSPYRIDVSDPKNPKVWSLGKNKIDEHDDPKSDDICSWR